MPDFLIIKPHHLIDILSSFSGGISIPAPHPYGHDVHLVTRRILGEPGIQLRLEYGADDICAPCIHNIDGICDDVIDTSFRPAAPSLKREYNLLLDQRWGQRLGLGDGSVVTLEEFCRRLLQCVSNLSEIYRELPTERIRKKEQELQMGLHQFLHNRKTSR